MHFDTTGHDLHAHVDSYVYAGRRGLQSKQQRRRAEPSLESLEESYNILVDKEDCACEPDDDISSLSNNTYFETRVRPSLRLCSARAPRIHAAYVVLQVISLVC